jgi:predicted MFS family arabinose efflux permease
VSRTGNAGPHVADARGAAFAGCAALLVGIGLARFGYSALIPALVEAGWLGAGAAAYLGAANLAGYLLGALAGRRLAAGLGTTTTLRVMLLTAALTFVVGAPDPPAWLLGLARLLSGVSGGVLMVLGPPVVLAVAPSACRGLIGGVMLAGVGLGIVASGPLVAWLQPAGPAVTWLAFAALSLALAIAAWPLWPEVGAVPGAVPGGRLRPTRATLALLAAYGLNAVGLVPHIVFLVDYAARGRGLGIAVAGALWSLYGLGAVVGPVLAGLAADRFGYRRAQLSGFALQILGVALALAPGLPALAASALLMGAFTPGVVPLVLGRVGEIAGPALQPLVWRWATVLFALGQAAGAYALTPVFAAFGYRPLFLVAILALTLALALAAWPARGGPPTA